MPATVSLKTKPYQPIYAQVVSREARDATIKNSKDYSGSGDTDKIVYERYKILVLSQSDDIDPNLASWARVKTLTSGLGAQSGFDPIIPPNSFVVVEQDENGEYIIVEALSNVPPELADRVTQLGQPATGFPPGGSLPSSYESAGGGRTSERPHTPESSKEDRKQDKPSTRSPEEIISACKNINFEAINSELENLIADVEDIRTGLLGDDSFLQTSQEFINEEILGRVQQASRDIAKWTSWLIQEMRQFIIRKVNGVIGNAIGNAPLNTQYIVNEAANKTLDTVSCIFARLIGNLENILYQALSALVDKVVNTAACLIENFMGNVVGQILGQLSSLINAALGPISSLLGSVISATGFVLDFVISILNFLKCNPNQVCPKNTKWKPLDGVATTKFNFDITGIMEVGSNLAGSFERVANIPEDLANADIGFDVGSALRSVLNDCGLGPESCGPPVPVFFGGAGEGGIGNAVINGVGDIIGVDIVAPGFYTMAPVLAFEDACGIGRGATGVPIIQPFPDTPPIPGISTVTAPSGGPDGGTPPPPPGGGDPGTPPPGTITPDTPPTPGISTVTPPPIVPGGGTTPPPPGGGDPEPTSPTTPPGGISGVIITNPGYGYLSSPDGSRGGNRRVYAGRCETVVQRANRNWEGPYKEGDVIELSYGDRITLPGRNQVVIDCDFEPGMLPGCFEEGTKYCVQKMDTFDDRGGYWVRPPELKSMVGFDDYRGAGVTYHPPPSLEHQKYWRELAETERAQELLSEDREYWASQTRTGRPDQFGFYNDYPYAREQGFSDQDIRFYLEGYYSKLAGKRLGALMRLKLEDPAFGPLPQWIYGREGRTLFDCDNDYQFALAQGYNDIDIRFYLENEYFGQVDDCMQRKLDDPTWGRNDYRVYITAPGCPPGGVGGEPTYDVIPVIGDVIIEDPGSGFLPGDTATVLDCAGNPDAAAKIDIKISQSGRITGAKVINPGVNFQCIPKIILNTDTGYNAKLTPVLKFLRVGEGGFEVPEGTTPLTVVDCVGKV